MSESQELGDTPGLIPVLTFLCAVAVFCNIMVLCVFLALRKKSSICIFIVNLAIADILLAGIALPLRLLNVLKETRNYNQGNFVCKLVMFLPKFSVVLSISTMVAMALDRYRAIVKQKQLKIRQSVWSVSIIWLIATCVSAPQIYEYNIYEKPEENSNGTTISNSCGSENIPENFETIYALVVVVASYCVPVTMLAVCYSSIMIYIWKTSGQFRDQTGKAFQIRKKRMKILKMLLTITIVFTVLWAPYFILFTMEEIMDLDDTSESSSWPHITKQVMVVISTFSNPTFYVIFDDQFRSGIVQLFTCRRCRPSQVTPNVNTWPILPQSGAKSSI